MSIIHVESIGKRYRIGERQRYLALRDILTRAGAAPLQIFRPRKPRVANGQPDHFWALKDVSFDIKPGEVVGIVGRNGAGKSTLLKILARVTKPTNGYADVHGRMGSLLEVGTGFHPELTGRENTFLSGAILGMSKAEIKRKFDEIVAFAEVEKFIDTPVKHYSSGMQLRLAFAVAAHLEPEILLVDEVLAVGDTNFQNKCLGKIDEVARGGRTILFVSHSMGVVQRLCSRVLVMHQGKIKQDTNPINAIASYVGENVHGYYSADPSPTRPTITKAAVSLGNSAFNLSIEFVSPFPLTPPVLGFVMYDPIGTPVFGTNARLDPPAIKLPPSPAGHIEVSIPSSYFRPHRYFFSIWLGDHYSDYCSIERVLQIELPEGPEPTLPPHVVGSLRVPIEWEYRPMADPLRPSVGTEVQQK